MDINKENISISNVHSNVKYKNKLGGNIPPIEGCGQVYIDRIYLPKSWQMIKLDENERF